MAVAILILMVTLVGTGYTVYGRSRSGLIQYGAVQLAIFGVCMGTGWLYRPDLYELVRGLGLSDTLKAFLWPLWWGAPLVLAHFIVAAVQLNVRSRPVVFFDAYFASLLTLAILLFMVFVGGPEMAWRALPPVMLCMAAGSTWAITAAFKVRHARKVRVHAALSAVCTVYLCLTLVGIVHMAMAAGGG